MSIGVVVLLLFVRANSFEKKFKQTRLSLEKQPEISHTLKLFSLISFVFIYILSLSLSLFSSLLNNK